MLNRFIIARRGCAICHGVVQVVNHLNLRLPLKKQIRIIDGFLHDEFGVSVDPIMNAVADKGFDMYPFIFISGIRIQPPLHPKLFKTFMVKLLEDDFII